MASLIRKQLSDTNLHPASTRYNPGTDTVQITNDGGITWQDAPTLDPRTSVVFQLPANPTSNPKCDAAERAIDTLADEINAFLNGSSVLQTVNTLIDLILVFVPGFGIVAAVIWVVVEALLAIGTTAIALAFSSEVYSTLKCLWFEQVGDDGVMSEAGKNAFLDSVTATWPTDAVIPAVVSLLVDDFGLVHLNNAAVTRTETGDCSECACPGCYIWDWTANCLQLGWDYYSGTWNDVDCQFQMTCLGGAGSDAHLNPYVVFSGSLPDITSMTINFNVVGSDCEISVYRQQSADPADIVLAGSHTVSSLDTTYTFDLSAVSGRWYGIDVLFYTIEGCGSSDIYVHSLSIESSNLCAIGISPNC